MLSAEKRRLTIAIVAISVIGIIIVVGAMLIRRVADDANKQTVPVPSAVKKG